MAARAVPSTGDKTSRSSSGSGGGGSGSGGGGGGGGGQPSTSTSTAATGVTPPFGPRAATPSKQKSDHSGDTQINILTR